MYVQGKALLFTTDIPNEQMECGKIEGVFATTDFGIDGSEYYRIFVSLMFE